MIIEDKSWDSHINVASVKPIYGIYQPSLLDTQRDKNKEVSTQMITTHRNRQYIRTWKVQKHYIAAMMNKNHPRVGNTQVSGAQEPVGKEEHAQHFQKWGGGYVFFLMSNKLFIDQLKVTYILNRVNHDTDIYITNKQIDYTQ